MTGDTRSPITLTQENHPENIVEPVEKPTTVKLGHTVFLGILCGLVGMTIGTVFGRIAGQEAARRARN